MYLEATGFIWLLKLQEGMSSCSKWKKSRKESPGEYHSLRERESRAEKGAEKQ